ncbi:MAG: Methicillin resistance protein [Candidatus Magasanikbacteria bacterium GW2011_GWE2_42_7]|uniref:Methicillin resistance protein n=1 Tax=Candidatus Magasanikbacteria bacterium GW2011_GWE2_42_7 TaxID=1619052 RepID=A0A0G1BI06_9BACT|nr:MAG: Methicillin resistance protein [Candidatus Magasanikbacteria bacterium GW2011_GWE2_42_7]
MYSIKKTTDIQAWDAFVKTQQYSPFVQSYKYGEFYRELGEHYWILGVYAGETLVGGSLVLTVHAKRGNFFYLPYGPMLDYTDSAMVQQFFAKLKRGAKKEHMDFIRISPFLSDTQEGRAVIHAEGYRAAPMHVLAENSWLLDLSQSEEQLLAQMKKNHRNLIRRCEREGVTVTSHTDQKTLDILHDMLDETEKRQHFTRFSRHYINTEFAKFAEDGETLVYMGTLPTGEADAAAIIMFYGNMAVYRHSASRNLDKKLPTSYLIQWHVIKEAKRRGMRWYNFWGVEPKDASASHPFSGIGHFKRGFGGFQEDLLHCQDLPITKKYWVNWIVETIRKRKRGF